MKLITENKKIENKTVRILNLLAVMAGAAIINLIILKIIPIINVWLIITGLSSSTKLILASTAVLTLLTAALSVIGCKIQLKRIERRAEIAKKLTELSEIVTATKFNINQYEEWMFYRYYYVNKTTIEKLAPAKWILASLEQKLSTINSLMRRLSDSQLNYLLDLQVEIELSPVTMLVYNESCLSLPDSLNFSECVQILKEIFESAKTNLEYAESAALKDHHFGPGYEYRIMLLN